MAPTRQSTRVTFERTVKPNSDTGVKKRKKQSSEEQTSGKRQRCNSAEDKDVRLLKRKNTGPLHPEVLQHIEACLNVAEMSVLSREKVAVSKSTQHNVSRLKQRLLKFCKNIRLPVNKVDKVKNLAKEILEEKRKMKVYEETLESLKHEIEEAVETTEKMEDAIETLEGKVETMKKQASEISQSQDQTLSNMDPMELPQETFKAPTMQDMAKKLKHRKQILKVLSQVQSKQIYKNAQNLIQMSYAETSML